jgi:hypothetical protein
VPAGRSAGYKLPGLVPQIVPRAASRRKSEAIIIRSLTSYRFSERAKQNQILSSKIEPDCFPENPAWEAHGKYESRFLRLRQAAAWPIYLIALILDFASAGLGRLAAWIAGDDWP